MSIENIYKISKRQWMKWREAAQAAYNRSMSEGLGFRASFQAAQEVNEYCIKNNIKVGLGPLAEEPAEEPEKAEEDEKPAKKPRKTRKKAKKADETGE